MDFDLNDEELALQEGVRRFCGDRFGPTVARAFGVPNGFDRTAWADLAALGVFGLTLPEGDGGSGLGVLEATLVYEALGEALVPGPVVACLLAGGLANAIMTGQRIATVTERATPMLVAHLRDADDLFVIEPVGISRFDVASVSGQLLDEPLDPTTRLSLVTDLGQGETVGDEAMAQRWRLLGSLLSSALLVGNAAASTALATEYAKHRNQFGRAIGSFQAVKHLLADCFARVEVARAAVHLAGIAMDDPVVADVERAVAGARVLAGRAGTENARTCIQVHGGMGFTWEVDAHLFLKRARLLNTEFGSGDAAAETVAAHLLTNA